MAKTGRPPKVPVCGHPDREHYELGMCRSCAGADSAPVPTCGHPGRKLGGNGMCRACYVTAWIKTHPDANSGPGWRKRNPEAYRANRRVTVLGLHGLTVEDYETMWHAQNGTCANPRCDVTAPLVLPDHRVGLVVDHNHATGAIRALLCPGCNRALGHAGEDRERLRGLADYLDAEN